MPKQIQAILKCGKICPKFIYVPFKQGRQASKTKKHTYIETPYYLSQMAEGNLFDKIEGGTISKYSS